MIVLTRSLYFAVVLSLLTVCNCLELSDKCRNFSINIADFSYGKSNTVLSPHMIWNLVFTVAISASGDTAEQILSALGIAHENEIALIKANKRLNRKVAQSGLADEHYVNGNFMFLHNTFRINPLFEAISVYGLELENKVLDFNNFTVAIATANSFIASTNGKLKNSFKKEDFYKPRMIFASSTSFEGTWSLPFNASDTTIEPFYDEKGEIIRDVYMMNQRNKFPFTDIVEIGAFVLQLPYGSNDKYCMLILLPSPGTTVSNVYYNLVNGLTIKDILYKLSNDTENYGLENIDIKIPRFRIVTNYELDNLLSGMGVHDIFNFKRANFRRVTSESMFVSKIGNAADINVSESGTVASASASVIFADEIVSSSDSSSASAYDSIKFGPVYSAAFIANRPFIYYVMEQTTSTILFGGTYSESF